MRIDRECLSCGGVAGCLQELECSNRRPYAAGEQIYGMADPANGAWQVLDGFVALRAYTESGEVALLRLVSKGGVFGYRSFIAEEPHTTCATALTDCRVKHIPAGLLQRMTEREPRLAAALQRSMADAFREAGARIVQLATQNVRSKFLLFCGWLADLQGTRADENGFRLALPLNQQGIAEALGVRPETLSRALRRLIDDGVVSMAGRQEIVFHPGWADYARGEAEIPGRL